MRKVGFPGCLKRIDRAVVFHGLKAVARVALTPVINDGDGAATSHKGITEFHGDSACLWAEFSHSAVRRRFRKGRVCFAEGRANDIAEAVFADANLPFVPFPAFHNLLGNRQGIKEFIRDAKDRSFAGP